MLGTHRDRKSIGPALDHRHRFSGTGSNRFPTLIFAPEQSDFRFQVSARRVNDLSKTLGLANIFSQRQMPPVVHHGIVAAPDTPDDVAILARMILMKQYWNIGGLGQ